MTLTEQEAMLVAAIGHYGMIDRERAMDIIAGISAEGFSIVGPEGTEEMRSIADDCRCGDTDLARYRRLFKAMLAAGKL